MSEISKIKVITLTPFTSSEYHLWIASALATFKVYKVDKLILGTEKEPRSDDKLISSPTLRRLGRKKYRCD